MASSLITNSHPPFLSLPNFSSFSIVCAIPPFFSSPSYSSAIQPLCCPPCSLNLSLTCFICPSPAVLLVPTLLCFFFWSLQGRLGLGLGSGSLLLIAKRPTAVSRRQLGSKGPGGEDKRQKRQKLMPGSMRQKSITECIAIFSIVSIFCCSAGRQSRQAPFLM